ncbi:MAG: phosphoadenylyl-sulfate reductase [Flavobacteriia bacterium]|nr:phosphoadenylyl-sulfate reductase [Flavobacteriia bacterium]
MKLNNIEQLSLEEILVAIADEFANQAAFSTSLSWEDQVITHHIFVNKLPIRVFTLDTGRLFPETYHVLNRTIARYEQPIEVFFPQVEATQELMTNKGPLSFYESLENRKECCFIRKVEPLNRALEGVKCWITGLRAEHSENRQDLEMIEKDEQRNLIKVQPLLNWTLDDVKAEISKNNIPYNILHDKGFVSIGCQPCTRAIKEGEDFRGGRWWWEDKSKKECGLHAS